MPGQAPNSIPAEQMAGICEGMNAALEAGPYSDALQSCLPIVYQSVRDNFTSSATPEGDDWPPRKHIGDGHPLLIDTGAMLQAAVGTGPGRIQEVGSHEAMVGVSGGTIPYAAIHNYGTAKMPQREFMGIDEAAEQACEDAIADYVLEHIL
jgi:phage gpG-like protein